MAALGTSPQPFRRCLLWGASSAPSLPLPLDDAAQSRRRRGPNAVRGRHTSEQRGVSAARGPDSEHACQQCGVAGGKA